MTADQCEMPPSYSGDSTTSVATVQCTGNTATISFYTDATLTTLAPPTGLVRQGDQIQFNFQGPLFTFAAYSVGPPAINPLDSNGYITGNTFTAVFDSSQGQTVPWTTTSSTVSYRIFRSPTAVGSASVVKSAVRVLQLPAGAVVDLPFSGGDQASSSRHGTQASIIVRMC